MSGRGRESTVDGISVLVGQRVWADKCLPGFFTLFSLCHVVISTADGQLLLYDHTKDAR